MLVALWQAIPAVRRPMARTRSRYSFPRHSNPSLSRSAGSTANCRKARLRSHLNSKHPDPFLWIRSTISSVPDNLNLYGSPRNIFLSMPSLTPCLDYPSLGCLRFRHRVQRWHCNRGVTQWVVVKRPQCGPQFTFSPNVLFDSLRELPGALMVTWRHSLMNHTLEADREAKLQEINSFLVMETFSQVPHYRHVYGCSDGDPTSFEVWQTWQLYQGMQLNATLHLGTIFHGKPGPGVKLLGLRI